MSTTEETSIKVLVVEDDPDLREILVYHLRREGYTVVTTGDGYECLKLVRREQPQVILLDLALEGLDGLQVCRQLQNDQSSLASSVIIVSARTEEDDVLTGLSLGADDYVRKPFKPKEVIARVKTVLRRARSAPSDEVQKEVLRFPPLFLNHANREVRLGDQVLSLTATEYRLLHFLMRHPERVFTRGQLLAHGSDHRPSVTGRNIDVHVRSLRRKLGPFSGMIDTARGVGYRFLPSAPASPVPEGGWLHHETGVDAGV